MEQQGRQHMQTTIKTFEKKVFDVEGIRIVVRGPANGKVEAYGYSNRLADNKTLSEFRKTRLASCSNSVPEGYEVAVIKGDGSLPRAQTTLGTVRSSYKK